MATLHISTMKFIEWLCILFFVACSGIEAYWLSEYFVTLAGATMPERSEWPAWVQAIGSLGAIWVAVWLFYAQHKKTIERAKIEEDSGIRNLLRSLKDEISVISETFEKRNGKLLMEGKEGEAFLRILPFVDSPFPIYQSSIANLGKIHNENLRRLIIVGYGRALGFVHSIKLNNVLIEKYENAVHVANIYNEDVHKTHREQRLHQLNLYGNSLRESYMETIAGARDMLTALEGELRQNP